MFATQVMQEFGESFVHKRLIGAVGGFFTGGLPGAAVGFATSGGGGAATSAAGGPGTPATLASLPAPGGVALPGRPGGACGAGFVRNSAGQCVPSSMFSGAATVPGATVPTALAPIPAVAGGNGTDMFGVAVMGMFGAALEPAAMAATRLRCPRGTVLGRDNLCYNKRDLRKSERKWNPGTKPVLTGGQVNTLKKAHRIQERMAKLGLTGAPAHHRKKARKLLR